MKLRIFTIQPFKKEFATPWLKDWIHLKFKNGEEEAGKKSSSEELYRNKTYALKSSTECVIDAQSDYCKKEEFEKINQRCLNFLP